jgi:nucleoside-diphosphate-sugar epimerase
VTLFNRGRIADPFGHRVERLTGDRQTDDLRRLLSGRSFDVVYDFAAYVAADVGGILDLCTGGRAGHYVLISSGQVYLVREDCPFPAREPDYDGPLVARPEDAADRAEWDYGVGKRACEHLLAEEWERSRFPATRIRIPMVEGERDHLRRLEGYLWRILDGCPILIPDGGTNPVRHVYVGDVVRALVRLAGHGPAFGRAFNLSQEETPTLVELLATIADLMGARPCFVPVSRAELAAAGLDVRRVFWHHLSILGSTMGNDAEFRQVVGLLAREVLRPVVDSVLPLRAAREAVARLASGQQFGKLVLDIAAPAAGS